MRLSVAKFIALALLGASVTGCGTSAPDEADTAESAQTITGSTCAQFGTINQGDYIIQADEWNSTQRQCISSTGLNFQVTAANFNLPSGAPATYPSIYKGCHWGACTPAATSGMPAQVSAITTANSSVNFNPSGSGAFDAAYDIWFNTTATTAGQPNGTEIMIWVSHGGFPQPFGSRVAQGVNLNGTSWDVWVGRMPTWNVVSYVRNPPANGASLDLKPFIADSVSRGQLQRAWFMIDIEFGFEIWSGGQGMAVNSFNATVTRSR